MRSPRVASVVVLSIGMLLVCSPQVVAQLEKCHKNIFSALRAADTSPLKPDEVEDCEIAPPGCFDDTGESVNPCGSGRDCYQLGELLGTITPVDTAQQMDCGFEFWTYAGHVYEGAQQICTDADQAASATAWYFCSAREGGDNGNGIALLGIDASAGDRLPKPWATTEPPQASGNCGTSNPCSADSRATAVTARGTAEGVNAKIVEFSVWRGGSTSQTIQNPSSPEISFYREPREPEVCKRGLGPGWDPCYDLPLDIIFRERLGTGFVWVDEICLYVLNCPGCDSPTALCAPWILNIFDDHRTLIALHDATTGKILAEARPVADGRQVLRFQPSPTPMTGEGLFLSFRPNPEARWDEGETIQIRMELEVPKD